MPLQGNKIYIAIPPLTDVKPGEDIFTIEHTGEQFRSRSEYQKHLEFYNNKTWTCQCTGHINLTHEQAWNSEKEKMDLLKKQFPDYFEKPVLEIVHHNTTLLDDLVDQTWTRLQQVLAVREPVALKVKSGGKEITGTVTRLDSTTVEPSSDLMVNGTSDGECNSPSSDKENKTSNGEATNSIDESPAKWQPPRLLPFKYSIALDESDKVISGIPASDIKRLRRTPSKDLVKLFIRSCSHRPGMGANSPWVVKDDMVKKFSLPSKFADIFMSPKVNSEKKKSTESGKKRKASSTPTGPAKKQKTDTKVKTPKNQSVLKPNMSSNSPKKGASPKKAATPKKGTPSKPKTPQKVVEISDSDTSDSDGDDSDSDSSAEDEMPLSDIKMGKSPSSSPKKKTLADVKKEMGKSPASSPKKKSLADLQKTLQQKGKQKGKKDTGKQTKKFKTKSADSAPKKRGRPSLDGSPSKKAKKNMKQATLFDMKGKKSGGGSKSNTPKKSSSTSPKKQTPVKLPPIVAKLQKELKKEKNKMVCNQLIAKCAKVLSARVRAALPEDIKEFVNKKYEQVAEKKKMDSMTPEQKEEYLKNKRKETAKKNMEKRQEQNKRFEDQDLKLAPLPVPKLVPTPDGLPNELFGEVAMVTQFISCYKKLLMPDDEYPIMTDALMKALVEDKAGFTYLARTLEVLLQTLLQDAIAEEYSELTVPLKSVTVTKWNVSELVRLCLRKHDADEARSSDSDETSLTDEDEVEEDLIEKLESEEIFSLRPEEKLQILSGLAHRIMSSYSVQDFMEQKQREAADLWKTKIKELKKKNDKLKQEREKKKAGGEKLRGRPSKEEEREKREAEKKKNMKNMTITNFYGAGSADNSAAESDGDITSVLKSRRVAAAKANEDRAKRERENLLRRAKETEEQKWQREKEQFEKRYADGIALAKLVYRHVPIGTDRNHNRYWVFHDATPGLYIEKGWAPKEIEYCVQGNVQWSGTDNDETSSPSKKKGRPKKSENSDTERTYPNIGQNLWFMYDNIKDLEQLVQNLNPLGIRESVLKSELQKIYPDTSNALYVAQRTNGEDSGSDLDLMEGLRSELLAMESGLRAGGLGGVDNFPNWEKKLKSAETIKEFGDLLVETQECISEKFRSGILAPIKQKLKVEVKKEGGEEEEMEVEYHEETIIKHEKVLQLQEAIKECPTFSRLHFLMGIIDTAIKWEKSAENAKCKICRKKGDEDYLLLCDECNQPFHLYCLRPALPEIPTGDWFCPSCRPLTQRKCRRETTNYRKLDQGTYVDSSDTEDGSDDDESDGQLAHEDTCAQCGGDEGLIQCSTCVSSFHMDCHVPPLLREPRVGTWKCMQCKSGVRLHTRTRRKAAENRKRWVKEEESEEESEEEAEESDDETMDEGDESEEEEKTPTRSSRRSTSNSRSTRRQSQESDSDSLSEYLTSGRRSSTRRSRESGAVSKEKQMKAVLEIIRSVTRNKNSWPFREPVEIMDVPDYYDIVTNPIDLLAMEEKCKDDTYNNAQEFVDDLALLFDNGDMYNKPESVVGKCIPQLETFTKNLLTKHLPDCTYQRNYNRAAMKSMEAHGYSDHAYC